MRESPDTASKVLKQLKEGNQLIVLESNNGWYKVISDGLTGWVSGAYVKRTQEQTVTVQYGKITGKNVNLRKGPGTSYGVICRLNKGDVLTVTELSDNWYKVKTSAGLVGWICSLYILPDQTVKEPVDQVKNSPEGSIKSDTGKNFIYGQINQPDEEAQSGSELKNEAVTSGESSELTGTDTLSTANFAVSELIDYAQSLVGVKYVYGGNSPEEGFDCSGFTRYVFSKFGINLERVAADQAKQGIEVTQDELLPGDLVFSDTDGGNNNINHVGIYIGEGRFISAASGAASSKVTISELNSTYWQASYMTARRIFKTDSSNKKI